MEGNPCIELKVENRSWDSFRDWKSHKLIAGTARFHLQSELSQDLTRLIHDFYLKEFVGSMQLTIEKCTEIPDMMSPLGDLRSPSPFVEVRVERDNVSHGETTNVLLNTKEPEWNEMLIFDLSKKVELN